MPYLIVTTYLLLIFPMQVYFQSILNVYLIESVGRYPVYRVFIKRCLREVKLLAVAWPLALLPSYAHMIWSVALLVRKKRQERKE